MSDRMTLDHIDTLTADNRDLTTRIVGLEAERDHHRAGLVRVRAEANAALVRRWLSDSRINHAEARSWPTGRYVPLCGATCDESYGWRLSSQRPNCKRCRRVRAAAKGAGR